MAFDPSTAQPATGGFDPATAQAPAPAFDVQTAQPVQKPFWQGFGEATGGLTGLASAPFTESIPAELIKAAAHPGRTYKRVEDFLRSDEKRPLIDRVRESFGAMGEMWKTDKGGLVGAVVKGLVADPELFFLPGLGGVKAAETAGKVAQAAGAGARTAKVAESAAGIGARVSGAAAIGGGAEGARELGEADESIDPGKIGSSALLAIPFGATQIHTPGRFKLSPEEVDKMLSTAPEHPEPQVLPTADGYSVHTEGGQDSAVFKTKEEAEAAKTEVERVASARRVLDVARGTSGKAEWRNRFNIENPFTPERMAELLKASKKEVSGDRLKHWAKVAVGASFTAAGGAWLDWQDPWTGASFGAGAVLGPKLLGMVKPPALLKAFGVGRDTRLSVEEVVNEFNGRISQWARPTFQMKGAMEQEVPEPLRRNAIAIAAEGGEASSVIKLNPAEQRVLQTHREFVDMMGQTAVEAGVLKDLLHNYVSHLVEDDPAFKNAQSNGTIDRIIDELTAQHPGGGTPGGKQFTRHRKYPTLGELHAALRGSNLRIKTADIAEIDAIYSNAMFRTITQRRLIDALKSTPIHPDAEARVGPPAVATDDRVQVGGLKMPAERPPGVTAQKYAAKVERLNLVMPPDKAPAGWVQLGNRQLAGLLVHPDIAPQLNFVFTARDPMDLSDGLIALSQASKRVLVSFSMFHAKTLSDAFILASSGTTALHPKRAIDAAMKMYRTGGNNDSIDRGLRQGLQIKPPEDISTDKLHSTISRIAKVVDETLPVKGVGAGLKKIAWVNDQLDRFTFGYLQTGFKLTTYLDAYERLVKKGLDKDHAARAAASYANDIYGGLDWFRIANDVTSRFGRDVVYRFFNPNGRKWMQLALFAADWTFSTFRSMYKAIPGVSEDEALAALHRRYLGKMALYYLTVFNGINLVTAGHNIWQNENPTRVQLADGRTMQLSKHSMEFFEWLRDAIQTADNKLAFIPRAAVQIGTNKEYVSAHNAAPDIQNRAETVAKMFTPIGVQQGLGGGGLASIPGSFLGAPIYGKTPDQRGVSRSEARKAKQKHQKEMAEYEQRLHR